MSEALDLDVRNALGDEGRTGVDRRLRLRALELALQSVPPGAVTIGLKIAGRFERFLREGAEPCAEKDLLEVRSEWGREDLTEALRELADLRARCAWAAARLEDGHATYREVCAVLRGERPVPAHSEQEG